MSDSSSSEPDPDDGQQGPPTTEYDQTMLDIGKAVDSLYRIAMEIRKGKPVDRYMKSSGIDTSFYEPYDMGYVREKFPAAEEFLINRLGMAISKRRKYLRYRELHAAKLSRGLPVETAAEIGATDPQEIQVLEAGTILSETTATTFAEASAFGSEHVECNANDPNLSGLRRSRSIATVATETSYATSLRNEGRIRMPSMPLEASAGQYFECPFCRKLDSVSSTHAWMKHVYKDLQPYLCTFEQCKTPQKTYESRGRWFDHELQQHRRVWTCSGHCSQMFRSRDEFEIHVRKYQPGGLATEQFPLFIESCSNPLYGEDAEFVCPLCTDQLHGGSPLEKHLGRHLEEIALFALPQNDSDTGNDFSSDPEAETSSQRFDNTPETGITAEGPIDGTGENWAEFYHLEQADVQGVDDKEIERQKILHEIVTSEQSYLKSLTSPTMFYTALRTWVFAHPSHPEMQKFKAVFRLADGIRHIHHRDLYVPLLGRQKEQGPWIFGFDDIFEKWMVDAETSYLAFAANLPAAESFFRRESERNSSFRDFISRVQQRQGSGDLGWTFMKAPITRLQRYGVLLQRIIENTGSPFSVVEEHKTENLVQRLEGLVQRCDSVLKKADRRVVLQELDEDLVYGSGIQRLDLNLSAPERKIILRGDILSTPARAAPSKPFGRSRIHAILFDNYLVLTIMLQHSEIDKNKGDYKVYQVVHVVWRTAWLLSLDQLLTLP
jgi:RhoGEF domain